MPEQPSAAVDKCVESIPVPPTPQVVKSSSEILCELFGAFNATPPSLDDITVPVEDVQHSHDKKHKKQSKKKSKKVKKKKKKRSSSPNSKVSNGSSKKKRKHNSNHCTSESESVSSKKKKRKLGKYSASDSDSEESNPKSKKKKFSNEESSCKHKPTSLKIKQEKECISKSTVPDLIQENILTHAVSRIVDKVIDSTKIKTQVCDTESNRQVEIKDLVFEKSKIDIKTEPTSLEKLKYSSDQYNTACANSNEVLEESIEPIPAASQETEDSSKGPKDDELKEKESDKPKPTMGKIKIQNLKFSQVYEATVKQIEEEAKRKAEKYEEGELSGTTSEEKSPTPSLPSSSESVVEEVLCIPVQKKKKRRHHEKREKCHHRRKRSRSRGRNSSHSHCHSLHKKRSKSIDGRAEERRHSKSTSQERSRERTKKWRHSRERSRSESEEESRDITKDRKKNRRHEKRKDRKRTMSRERSKDRAKDRRSKDRSRSRDRSKDWITDRRRNKESSRSPEKIADRKHDREESEERFKSSEKNKDGLNDRKRNNDRASSKERNKKTRHGHSDYASSRDKDKIKRGSVEKIDKQKLLEIARKNALSMMKGGTTLVEQNKVVSITAGGKTVSELTDFCKLLSQKDAEGHESISSDTEPSSGSESENRPFHHPFQLKDRNASIVLNIRNSVALPVKSLQEKTVEQARELRLQFPVSSGQHHRKTESEWIPVSPKRPEPLSLTAPPPPAPSVRRKRTFTDTPDPPMIEWRDARREPLEAIGQFTGSTGVRVLTQAELASGQQAWARR